tara:strand:+ start:1427 stop:1606 length:180 start_codon:yes stop_codon:yes gene_type:complete
VPQRVLPLAEDAQDLHIAVILPGVVNCMTGLLEPPQAGRDMSVIMAEAGIVGQEGKARE